MPRMIGDAAMAARGYGGPLDGARAVFSDQAAGVERANMQFLAAGAAAAALG
jgi:hypothetical protein